MKIIIVYDKFWEDYYHNGSLIINLEKFISTVLSKGGEVKFEVRDD